MARDYALTFYDGSQNKLLDVANTVLAIEVQAAFYGTKQISESNPRLKEKVNKQATAGTKSGVTVPPTVGPPSTGSEKGTKSTSTTAVAPPQVQDFLKSIQAAQSLAEVQAWV